MDKILILKNENDDFEKYISDKMRTDNVEANIPYRKVAKILFYVRAVCKRLPMHNLMGIWLNDWKYKLDTYKTIIVFDNGLSIRLLRWIKKENPKCNLKVWLWNVPVEQVDVLKQYACVYCFDEKYSLEHGLKFIEQFYFEPIDINKRTIRYDLSFVGADKGRYKAIKDIANYLSVNNFKFYFYITNPSSIEYQNGDQDNSNIKIGSKKIAYEEVIKIVNESKAVLELVKSGQEGMTLRALEAMFYKKKLVTNNKNIRKYDWYSSDNIFILGIDKLNKLKSFFDSPFINFDNKALHKHAYKNWLMAITRDMQENIMGEESDAGKR